MQKSLELIKSRFDAIQNSQFFVSLDMPRFVTQPITESMFETVTAVSDSDLRIFAIDGGNSSLFSSPTLHVEFLRVACCEYSRDTFSELVYSFIGVITRTRDSYVCQLEGYDSGEDCEKCISYFGSRPGFSIINGQLSLTLSRSDSVLRDNPLFSFSRFVRKQLELALGHFVCSGLAVDSYVVLLDGSLVTRHDLETIDYSANMVGISKTSELVTTSQQSVSFYLMQLAEEFDVSGAWVARDLAHSDKVVICFVKLHPRSEFVFRFDVARSVLERPAFFTQVLQSLVYVSSDVSFLGYPYVLTKADALARVSNEQREYVRHRFMQSFDVLSQKQLYSMQRSLDAHSILDSLKF